VGGTTISQLLLMDVAHQPYAQYMWEHVLKPLGMINSTYTQPVQPKEPRAYAAAYYENRNQVKGKYHLYPEQGAAGLWTTPTDIAKYIIETQLALAGKSNKVLNQEMTRLRLTPYVDKEAALGVFILEKGGKKYFSHNGQDEGFTAAYLGSFDGNGVVVMSNSNSSALNSELVNSVATVYGWTGLIPEVRKAVDLPDTAYSKLLGTYKIAEDTLTISKREKDLIVSVKGTPIQWKMNFTSPSAFFLMELKGDFELEETVAGKVRTMVLVQGSSRTKIQRIE
jgi:CubicO group peptidase (beta-lactamase class C family)